MKRVRLVVGALLVASLMFVSCGKQNNDDAKDVSANSVLTVATESGIEFSANAKAVENKEDFEKVLPQVSQSLSIVSDKISGVLKQSNLGRAAITDTEIKDSITDLKTKATKFEKDLDSSKLMTKDGVDAKLNWNGPIGDYEIDNGIKVNISNLSLNANVKTSVNDDAKLIASANGNGVAKLSTEANLKKAYNINDIPVVIYNTSANANSNVALKIDVLKLAGLSNASSAIANLDTLFDELSGNVSGKYTLSGAAVLNTSEYAGVIKIDGELSVNQSINVDEVKKYIKLYITNSNMKEPSEAFLNALPVTMKFVVSVYDKDGKFVFDYLKIENLADAYKMIKSLSK